MRTKRKRMPPHGHSVAKSFFDFLQAHGRGVTPRSKVIRKLNDFDWGIHSYLREDTLWGRTPRCSLYLTQSEAAKKSKKKDFRDFLPFRLSTVSPSCSLSGNLGSLQDSDHCLVYPAVRDYGAPGINRRRPGKVGKTSSGFSYDNLRGGYVPRLNLRL